MIILAFLFITGPTAIHAVVNAAYVAGRRPEEANESHEAEIQVTAEDK